MSDLVERLNRYGAISSRGQDHPQNMICRDAAARIEALEAALQKQRMAWSNALELDLLPDQHRQSAEFLRDEAASLLEKP